MGSHTDKIAHFCGFAKDAGSSGTRMFMYQWYYGEIPSVFGAPVFQPFNATSWTLRVTPGLSTFSTHLSDLPAYFQPFLDYAASRIPQSYWSRTYVFLYATAGMRLLSPGDQARVLDATRTIFDRWPFRFLRPTWSRVISGVDEGVYGWMTANYLLGSFGARDPLATVGALDLGGASTQITFVPSTPVPVEQGGTKVMVGGVVYPLYSVSYLGLGIDQARARKNDLLLAKYCPGGACTRLTDGCLPLGFEVSIETPTGHNVASYGSSDGKFCEGAAFAVPPKPVCANCTIGDVQQPPLRGRFYAMSGFAHSLPVWNLNGTSTSIEDLEMAAQNWCSLTYDQIRALQPTITPAFLTSYCFTGIWETTLLRAWGFPPASRNTIVYTEKVAGVPLSWTLGAMVIAAQEVDSMQAPRGI